MKCSLPCLFSLFLVSGSVGAAPATQKVLRPQIAGPDSILWKLRDAQVIPDVLPSTFSPLYSLLVAYPPSHSSVDLGNTIPVDDTSSRPVFQLIPLNPSSYPSPTPTLAPNSTLTLVLSDPDATSYSNPTMGQFCHWVISGIARATEVAFDSTPILTEGERAQAQYWQPLELREWVGTDREGNALEGAAVEELVKYKAPSPPPKTGYHRYVFVLLEEEEDRGGGPIKAPKKRPRWGYKKKGKGVMDWARENGLRPVGANFFYTRNTEQ